MTSKFAQTELPSGLGGGSDIWDQPQASVVLDDDFFEAPAPAGSPYTLTVSPAAVTLAGGSVALRTARKLPVASRSIATTGQAVTARYGRKAGVSSASVTLSGGAVTLRVARRLGVTTGTVTLTGGAIDPVYTPAAVVRSLVVETGALQLAGGSVGFTTTALPAVPAASEVNWPGTSLSKDEFRARQRAILARIIAEEREERQKQAELAVKPVKKAAKKAARRIIRKAIADGILSGQAEGVETQIIAAMTGSVSLSDVLARVAELEWQHLQQIAAFEDRLDEEAAAILLLAA